jgi:hypothetical protein
MLVQVRLLLGEIPERVEFSTPGMRAPLQSYFELTTAVRSGDLATFRVVTEKYRAVFKEDKTTNLITRLHHNVIRTGLRRINLAYSRISLKVMEHTGPDTGWTNVNTESAFGCARNTGWLFSKGCECAWRVGLGQRSFKNYVAGLVTQIECMELCIMIPDTMKQCW